MNQSLLNDSALPVLTDVIELETPLSPLANLLKAAGDPLRL